MPPTSFQPAPVHRPPVGRPPLPPTVVQPPVQPSGDGDARPLVVTDDPVLLDDLLRLATAAGVEPYVTPGIDAARGRWSAAPLVLVGADQAAALVRAALPHRPATVLVARTAPATDAHPDVFELAVDLGAERVALLPEAEQWLVDAFADATEQVTPAVLVSVLGGRGGAGATTLAAALAVTASARGSRAMLVDADPLGGGIDLVVGADAVAGLRWSQLSGARGRVGAAALHAALPRVDELTVLSFDRGAVEPVPAEAMTTLLRAARRGHDLVVTDVSRRLDDASRVALQASDVTLLVVPAEVRAAVAASRVVHHARPHCSDLRLLVRGPAPSGLAGADLADALALPLAGELRAEPGVAADLERGEPPAGRGKGPLAGFCRSFLDGLGVPSGRSGRAA
jgi:secretion/DNA translocation related CpaE-like protein